MTVDDSPVPAAPGTERLELSPLQEETLRRPGPATVLTLHIEGPLHREQLALALRHLTERHEPLRTRVETVAGRPVQTVGSAAPVEPEFTDLTALPTADRATRVKALLRAAATPIDPHHEPLLRPLLVRLADAEHLLALAVHPLAADPWSGPLIAAELPDLYADALAERPPRRPTPRVRYADHAARQRGRLTEAGLAAQLHHWRERLTGLPALSLPADRPGPQEGRTAGEPYVFRVPATVVRDLTALARAHDGTLLTGLFTACQVLFSRHSGQRDLALATLTDDRDRPELTTLIGAFANPVVLRGTVRPDVPLARLLADNATVVRDALTHRDVPYGRVAEAHGTAPADVLLTLREDPEPPAGPDGPTMRAVRPAGLPVSFGITLDFTATADGALTGTLVCDTRFSAGTVRRLAGSLLTLLTGAVAQPDRAVGDLPLLDAEQRRTLIDDWGTNPPATPPDRCVPELVADQARTRPDAVAVVDDTGVTTYGALDAHANRTAHLLLASGVRPGAVVAACLPRGAGLVAVLLGVLRAGCAYLPLDPGNPPDRLAFMLADADAACCLTDTALTERLPRTDVPVLCPDRERDALAAQPATAPDVPLTPRHAAYVMYTSGSTGRPKGTVVEHRSITRLVHDADYVRLHPDDVMGQVATPAFDAATFEFWMPLVAGARLAVIDKDTLLDPVALPEALRRHGVTVMFLTSLILGGDESSRASAAGAVLAFTRHPDQWRRLSGGEVGLETAGEEVLRWTTPTMHFGRRALVDVTVRDRTIKAGEIVTLWNISANFDEHAFADPYAFDLARTPNKHVSFGHGPHFCLGAYLGRVHMKAMLEALRDMVADVELRGEPKRLFSNFGHGHSSMPVRLHARA
ncbi:Carrier domain-containing protein OS=Streptomyces aurantiogriseus OX=66870 GN=GCM10010251_95690 PE=4 SV=1 [Streptomyces aurantiogriseus]